MAEQKIRAIMIVEIAGRPPEHVKESLKNHVGQLKNLKDIEYISEDISEPKRIDAEKDIYTCFAEVEIGTPNFLRLIDIIFDFMPSSIEIIEPGELKLNTQEATSFANTLSGRLHRYDEIAKIAQIQNQQLAQKLQLMQQEVMKKDKPKKKSTKKKSGKKNNK